MRAAVIVFPGTWSDSDTVWALERCGFKADKIWHRTSDLTGYDLVVLPGGFSYGDYLRCGAIARFSPVMGAVRMHAENGGLLIGICNGFQILCEAGILPGVLMRNSSLQFRCKDTYLISETFDSAFTSGLDRNRTYQIPMSHGEGRYVASSADLEMLEQNDQIAFRYASQSGEVSPEANPNGSIANIAGIFNSQKNVLGMMPHPERACEMLLGSEDGNRIWESVLSQA
ncbi:MAG TPA: phosphoribosylformylglycinamidine synthase subunit PurQ [Dehalococcoidia bacterium]|jgi:phosphoribosylformylglycinamidine synthase|nr:phosphoribosylformylglycinamidine synthase subunit PurQ [Dehalococcoidia bacterium]